MNRICNTTGHQLEIPDMNRGEGVYLYDDRGKKYMDLESGVWCTSLGHGNSRIVKVLTEQAGTLMHAGFCYSHPILEETAAAVLSVTGFNRGKCVFLCSGSEAIEFARQASRHLAGKKLSMTLHDTWLGSYSSLKEREKEWYLFNWEECAACPRKEQCDPACRKLGDVPEDISEFIFEPGSSSGFVRFPPESLIRNLVDLVRSRGGKIIVNEVTTGIGRTGEWFGFNHYRIEPDMVAAGKGIGNGYPVSAVLLEGQTAAELEAGGFKYMQSHQNDPLGAAIVHEVIDIIREENLIEKARVKGRKFLEMLKTLEHAGPVGEVRGRGLMFALDLRDAGTGDRIYRELLDRGYVLCNRKGLFRIDPPLIIEEHEFAEFFNVFSDVLAAMR